MTKDTDFILAWFVRNKFVVCLWGGGGGGES